jgi:tetratricopeptide (TPR) repeat protein
MLAKANVVASVLLPLSLAVSLPPQAGSQESQPTVRHHRVAENSTEDATTPEVDQAETAIAKGDFAAAQALLQKAVAANPEDYRAWFDLGYVYNVNHQVPEAIDAYRKSVAARPDVFESNLNLGILLAKQGQNAEAAKYLTAATRLKPTAHPDEGLARAWQSLGHLLEGSDPQQALSAYSQAAKRNPRDADPHLSAGILLEKQNNLEAAAHEYQAAADLDPKSQEAIAGLANIYTREKKYPQAEAALRQLLEVHPSDNNARVQLGRVLAAQGKTEDAARELQAGLHTSPADPQAALELGTLYVNAGKDSEAEQQLRIAVVGMPQSADAHLALGSLLMHEKKYPEAQQELLIAIKLQPDDGQAYGNLAVVASENKDYKLAIRALDARAKYLPETAASYFLRATSYDYLKAVPQAVEYYQRFLAAPDVVKMPDQQWQARHRLVALDPQHRDRYQDKK